MMKMPSTQCDFTFVDRVCGKMLCKNWRKIEANEWRPKFNVKFTDEAGVDDGGLSREYFTMLYSASLRTSLFTGQQDWVTFAHN